MGSVGAQPFLQICSIGFRSGLWLGHSSTFTEWSWSHSFHISAVCLGLSCWQMNCRPSLTSRALEQVFFQDVSVHCCIHLYLNPDLSPSSCRWKTSHSMMLPPPCVAMLHLRDGIGQVISSAWFPPNITLGIHAKEFHLVLIGTFKAADIVLYPSQICASRQSCLGGLQTIPWTSCLICGLTCTVTCGTFYRQVCAFPKHVQSTELTTGWLQLSCRNKDDQWKQNALELNFEPDHKGCEYFSLKI